MEGVICSVGSSSTLNKGIVRPRILFGYKFRQKCRVNEDFDQSEAISQAFSVLFSEKNIMDVSYCFEQPDVLEALKNEPALQPFGVQIDAFARLGQIDESIFDSILSTHGPTNHVLREQVENFYQLQRSLYKCSYEAVQESGSTVVVSTQTARLPITEGLSVPVHFQHKTKPTNGLSRSQNHSDLTRKKTEF